MYVCSTCTYVGTYLYIDTLDTHEVMIGTPLVQDETFCVRNFFGMNYALIPKNELKFTSTVLRNR